MKTTDNIFKRLEAELRLRQKLLLGGCDGNPHKVNQANFKLIRTLRGVSETGGVWLISLHEYPPVTEYRHGKIPRGYNFVMANITREVLKALEGWFLAERKKPAERRKALKALAQAIEYSGGLMLYWAAG